MTDRASVGVHPLDNAVWHSILTARAHLAERTSLAGRFAPDVSPFAAVADDPGPEAWDELARVLGRDGGAAIFRRIVDPPPSWTVIDHIPGVQMLGEEAFLHAAADNEPAIRLYEALGFEHRCTVDAVAPMRCWTRSQPPTRTSTR